MELWEPGVVLVRISVPFTLILNAVGLMFALLVKVKLLEAGLPVAAEPPDGPVLVDGVISVSTVNPPLQAEAPAGAATEQFSAEVGAPTLLHEIA